jgi:hypothetical protein
MNTGKREKGKGKREKGKGKSVRSKALRVSVAQPDSRGSTGVAQKAGLPDARDAPRQDVLDEATENSHGGECHRAALIAMGIVRPVEGDVIAVGSRPGSAGRITSCDVATSVTLAGSDPAPERPRECGAEDDHLITVGRYEQTKRCAISEDRVCARTIGVDRVSDVEHAPVRVRKLPLNALTVDARGDEVFPSPVTVEHVISGHGQQRLSWGSRRHQRGDSSKQISPLQRRHCAFRLVGCLDRPLWCGEDSRHSA